MNEGDPAAGSASPWYFVHQPIPGGPAALERGVEIGNPIADMVDARASAGQESPNRGVRLERREQLHLTQGQTVIGCPLCSFSKVSATTGGQQQQ